MNPDRWSEPGLRVASTRNFKGRQGSPTGRTLLMSPAMVAAAALAGEAVDRANAHDGGRARARWSRPRRRTRRSHG